MVQRLEIHYTRRFSVYLPDLCASLIAESCLIPEGRLPRLHPGASSCTSYGGLFPFATTGRYEGTPLATTTASQVCVSSPGALTGA